MSHAPARMVAALLSVAALSAHPAAAQEKGPSEKGPFVEDFGPVYWTDSELPLPEGHVYRAVFDISAEAPAADAPNPAIETVARFLNMHARAGVPREDLKAVAVMHGGAARDVLTDRAYRERYGVPNPNLPLLRALEEAGVELWLCGQSAGSRRIARDEVAEPVGVALSAMTVLLLYQDRGYLPAAF